MKFGKLEMPKGKEEKEMPMDSELDMFAGEMEDEGSEEDMMEDKEEGMGGLAEASDDELLAEVKKRGLSL